jgi:hypothetical protein
MTSTTMVYKRRRCGCGMVLDPHLNGTIPRHTTVVNYLSPVTRRLPVVRKRCVYVGQLFPAIARERGRGDVPSGNDVVRRARGGKRASKRDTKNLFRRNAAGGYNGRTGSAGSKMIKVG